MVVGPGLCPGGDVVVGQLGSLDFPFLQGSWRDVFVGGMAPAWGLGWLALQRQGPLLLSP